MYYYVGTVILKMSSREFWHCTPRKLAALSQVHSDIHNPKKNKEPVTIDGVPVKQIPNSSTNGVGAPNAFIDQVGFPR